MKFGRTTTLLALSAAVSITGCESLLDPGADGQVSVAFDVAATPVAGLQVGQQGGSLLLTGTNGTLRVDQLHVIVDRFELKRIDDNRCAEEDHLCERFSAPPMLLDLPLDGSSRVAVRQVVPSDTYRRLRFEIEDLDDDEENAFRAQQIRELRTAIRARFPDWPRDASLLAVGTFTPTGGTPQTFRTYLEAEIEIEHRLVPPVTISAGESGGTFTVHLDLALVFGSGSGRVLDLAALDFDRTRRVAELRVEVEDGFTRVEFRR